MSDIKLSAKQKVVAKFMEKIAEKWHGYREASFDLNTPRHFLQGVRSNGHLRKASIVGVYLKTKQQYLSESLSFIETAVKIAQDHEKVITKFEDNFLICPTCQADVEYSEEDDCVTCDGLGFVEKNIDE